MKVLWYLATSVYFVMHTAYELPVSERSFNSYLACSISQTASSSDIIAALKRVKFAGGSQLALLVITPNSPQVLAADDGDVDAATLQTLAAVARRLDRDIVHVGGVTALVPKSMQIIETNPDKPNPFAGIRSDEAWRLLMGTLTDQQWASVCSTEGIGAGDLNSDQSMLLGAMLPQDLTIAFPNGGANHGDSLGQQGRENIDRSLIRFRINRDVGFALVDPNKKTDHFGKSPPHSDHALPYFSAGYNDNSSDNDSAPRTSLYGVKLVRTVKNLQKQSQIDYESPNLDRVINLSDLDETCTVGKLVGRVAQNCRLDIVCDRRVSDIPTFVRGDSARAGDLLHSIALGVTGTFRRIGSSSTFILTSDIDGAGARLTRLEDWAGRASAARKNLLAKAVESARQHNPLSYMTFAPDDPFALSESLSQHLDDGAGVDLHREETTDSSLLPQALLSAINDQVESLRSHGTAVDNKKVRLFPGLYGSFLVPGIGVVSARFIGIGNPSLMTQLAAKPISGMSAMPAMKTDTLSANWNWMNAPRKQKILLIRSAPKRDFDHLVSSAHLHGFTSIWLSDDMTADPAIQQALLSEVVRIGKRYGLTVCACLSVFRSRCPEGEPERNILGQTPDEFIKGFLDANQKADPDGRSLPDPNTSANLAILQARYGDWRAGDIDVIARRANIIGKVRGLAGLVLRGTAAPGYIPYESERGLGPDYPYKRNTILNGGDYGFTDAFRVAYAHERGTDPVDVRGDGRELLRLDLNLSYFPEEDKNESDWLAWAQFRASVNIRQMRDLYQKIRNETPSIPLWIDDRVSDYMSVSDAWFGIWDDSARMPNHRASESQRADLTAAKSFSKTVLLTAEVPACSTDADWKVAVSRVAEAGDHAINRGWDGVVVDISATSLDNSLALLDLIPHVK